MIPVTRANAAISASSANAPAPGSANMITPKATESSPLSPSSSARRPLSGSSKARPMSKAPVAIAHAAMAYSSPSADRSGQTKTTAPTATPSSPWMTSQMR
jgi:hypothetical protein